MENKFIRVITDLKKETTDLRQRVVNTIIEVEILRTKTRNQYDGSDNKYRIEQARLMNILTNEFSRSDIDKLIRKEIQKVINTYCSTPYRLMDMVTTTDLITEYILEEK
jgi:hypothetical protein